MRIGLMRTELILFPLALMATIAFPLAPWPSLTLGRMAMVPEADLWIIDGQRSRGNSHPISDLRHVKSIGPESCTEGKSRR